MQETSKPPSIDPIAANRWQRHAPLQTPWLHDEVARRMAERLPWIKRQPRDWLHWDVLRNGGGIARQLSAQYPKARVYAPVPEGVRADYEAQLQSQCQVPWWKWERWIKPPIHCTWPPAPGVDLLWANMAMHQSADPAAMIKQWHSLLRTDGFLMFSCLGPDTLAELRALYQHLGWPAPSHAFTDMHDYGDMLVQAGFAEPVMDMERITLTFATPERLLQELRELGRNCHTERFSGLRTRAWQQRLLREIGSRLLVPSPEGGTGLALTFEIIYGHALRPLPRIKLSEYSAVSLQDMRSMLNQQ